MQFTFHQVVPLVKKVGDRDDFLVSIVVGMTAVTDDGRRAQLELNYKFPETSSDPFIPFSEMTRGDIYALCERVADDMKMREKLIDMLAGPAFKPFAALGPGTTNDVFAEPVPPPPPPTPQEVIANTSARIIRERDQRKNGGVKVGTHWFHSDADSRIQQLGLVMMGPNIPADLQWKTMSGEFVTVTQELAYQIFQGIAMLDQALYAKAEEHIQAMAAAPNPASYDFTTGWPEQYTPAQG